MNRPPIWFVVALGLSGCQEPARPHTPLSDVPCPSPGPCDETGAGASGKVPWHVAGLQPGCPETLQVMLHRIVFGAVRPVPADDAPPDEMDTWCEQPEAPLLRADRGSGPAPL